MKSKLEDRLDDALDLLKRAEKKLSFSEHEQDRQLAMRIGDFLKESESPESMVERIFNKANKIMASDLSWEAKYDAIFSDEISVKVRGLFYWYAPDTTYEADVRGFMKGFTEYMENKKIKTNNDEE